MYMHTTIHTCINMGSGVRDRDGPDPARLGSIRTAAFSVVAAVCRSEWEQIHAAGVSYLSWMRSNPLGLSSKVRSSQGDRSHQPKQHTHTFAIVLSSAVSSHELKAKREGLRPQIRGLRRPRTFLLHICVFSPMRTGSAPGDFEELKAPGVWYPLCRFWRRSNHGGANRGNGNSVLCIDVSGVRFRMCWFPLSANICFHKYMVAVL